MELRVVLCKQFVRSRGKLNPRMLKRRNSPFASHDPSLPLNQRMIVKPALLPHLPLSKHHRAPKGRK